MADIATEFFNDPELFVVNRGATIEALAEEPEPSPAGVWANTA